MAQLVQRGSAYIPVTAVKVMHGQIGHQGKRIGNSRDAPALGSFGHIQLLDNLTLLIAEELELGAEPRPESSINFRRIDADDRELTIVDRQFFLKFYVVAQLHLALGSPVSAVKGDDQRELARQLRQFHPLSVVVLQFDIGKALTDRLVHTSYPRLLARLIFLCHFREITFFVQLLQ
jgi:hypothetical protein